MHDWYCSNFFTDDLLVKRLDDVSFEPLGTLILKVRDASKPFLLPSPPPVPPGFPLHRPHHPRGPFDPLPPSREPSDPWNIAPSPRQPQVPSRQFTTAYDPFAPTQERILEPSSATGVTGHHGGSLDAFAVPRSSMDPWMPNTSSGFGGLHSAVGRSPWSPDFGSPAQSQVFGEPQPFRGRHNHPFNFDALPNNYPTAQPDLFAAPTGSSTPFFDSYSQAPTDSWAQRARPIPTPTSSVGPIGQSPWGGSTEAARSSTFDERMPLLPRSEVPSITGQSVSVEPEPIQALHGISPPAQAEAVESSPTLPMTSKLEPTNSPTDSFNGTGNTSFDSLAESDTESWQHVSTESRAPIHDKAGARPVDGSTQQGPVYKAASSNKISVVSEAEFERKLAPTLSSTTSAPNSAQTRSVSPSPSTVQQARPAPWASDEAVSGPIQPSISLREIQAKEAEEARRVEAKRAAERQARVAAEQAALAAAESAEAQEALAPTSTWASSSNKHAATPAVEAPWAKGKPTQQVKKTLKEIQDEEARQKKAAQQQQRAPNGGYAGLAAAKPSVCIRLENSLLPYSCLANPK
jgi:PERQ amino acid-rich with GYF domain-containing protein